MNKNGHEKAKIPNITQYNSVLIGLVGHVDSGKTALARMISEIVSTAGLDAHPQSKERGITIDLGFTSLIIDDNLITLVDAPGHADLIKSVVASANIIEGGILVIDSKAGMQIQTAEHLVILESLNIGHLLIVLNKIDLVDEDRIKTLENELKTILKGSNFKNNTLIVRISAKNNIGGNILKDSINKMITEILQERVKNTINESTNNLNDLIFPIDHHFRIKGKGTIVTGTTLSGGLKTGDVLTIIPQKKDVKVKSIQIYHQDIEKAPKGFRVGTSITGLEDLNLERGNIITNNIDLFTKCDKMLIKLKMNKYFKKNLRFGTQISVTIGLSTVNARIFPFSTKDQGKFQINNLIFGTEHSFPHETDAYLWLLNPAYIRKDETLLLSQLDLPPTTLRFFGTAKISEILNNDIIPELNYMKTKNGKIKNAEYAKGKVVIEGLANSKFGADTLIGRILEKPFGKIMSSFGSKGVVVAEIRKNKENSQDSYNIKNGVEVTLNVIRSMKLRKDKAY